MSDAFILKKGVGIKDGMGKEIQTPIYIQFVPGIVGIYLLSSLVLLVIYILKIH